MSREDDYGDEKAANLREVGQQWISVTISR